MTELTDFIRARLDDDGETLATLDSTALNGIESTAGWSIREYVERGRAEVEAKRRILDSVCEEQRGLAYNEREQDQEHAVEYSIRVDYGMRILRRMALPYAGHPDYRADWRP